MDSTKYSLAIKVLQLDPFLYLNLYRKLSKLLKANEVDYASILGVKSLERSAYNKIITKSNVQRLRTILTRQFWKDKLYYDYNEERDSNIRETYIKLTKQRPAIDSNEIIVKRKRLAQIKRRWKKRGYIGHCVYCKDVIASYVCGNCLFQTYCSKECQEKEWASHNIQCLIIEK